MMDENSLKYKKTGGRPMSGEVKKSIIMLVLEIPGHVEERKVLKYLKDSNIVHDQSNVNRHFNDLHDLGCLEKVRSRSSINFNKWNITKFKTLKKIRHFFPEMPLNKFEKSLTIVLRESGYDINYPWNLELYIQLLLSKSFFNACMDIGLNKLLERAWEIFQCEEDSNRTQQIIELQNKFYETNIKNNPNFEMLRETYIEIMKELHQRKTIISELLEKQFCGLTKVLTWDTYSIIRNRMYVANLDFSKKISNKCNSHKEIEEKFPILQRNKRINVEIYLKIFEELDLDLMNISGEKYFEIWKEKFIEIFGPMTSETFLKIDKELPYIEDEILKDFFEEETYRIIREKEFSNWALEKKIPMKIFWEIIEQDLKIYDSLNGLLSRMLKQRLDFETKGLELLQKPFFDYDKYIDVNYYEILKFTRMIKENHLAYQHLWDSGEYLDALNKLESGKLEIYSKIIVKYKHPVVDGKIYDNVDHEYQHLKKFVNSHRQNNWLFADSSG